MRKNFFQKLLSRFLCSKKLESMNFAHFGPGTMLKFDIFYLCRNSHGSLPKQDVFVSAVAFIFFQSDFVISMILLKINLKIDLLDLNYLYFDTKHDVFGWN